MLKIGDLENLNRLNIAELKKSTLNILKHKAVICYRVWNTCLKS